MGGSALAGFLLALSSVCAPGGANDPFTGSWLLDPSQSDFVPNTLAKKTISYASEEGQTTLSEVVVMKSGETHQYKIRYGFDGRFTPQTASPLYDGLAVMRIDPCTTTWTLKLAGKIVGRAQQAISTDGATLTMMADIKDQSGREIHQKSVFHRQPQ